MTTSTLPPRPSWFEDQMRGRPEADREAEWARRCRSDYERDDVASEAMARGFEWLKEQQRLGKLPPPHPPATRPKTSLVEHLLAIGCIDGRTANDNLP